MFTTLLLPLLLAGTPAGQNDDPPVQLWISNDRRFLPGDRVEVHVRAEDDGYLVVLHTDVDGNLRVLFPLDPDDDNFVRGGKKYELHDRGGRDAFEADAGSGRGTVYAAYSRAPFRFGGYVLADHWDYRALAPDPLPRDPENELTEIVSRMAGGSFDYDVLTYDVIERVVYGGDYSYSRPYYSSFHYDDPWCGGHYWRRCGSGISVGVFFGRPYRYGYRPYFYDPFFYDPYYYRPAYYYPIYRHYYRPYYHRPYYHPGYRDWRYTHRYRDNRPYTPYRFRGFDSPDHRDRDYGFRRAVNTVYTAPASRLSEPPRANPIRRAVEARETERPAAVRREATRRQPEADRREPATRRSAVAERPTPSVERGRIEARRAREREPVMRDARESRSESRPVEIKSRRAQDDRPSVERAPVRTERPSTPEARRAAPERRPEVRAQPRAVDRPSPSTNRGRAERSSPPRSSSAQAGGGGRSGGRASGGGGGGGRRR